VYARAHVGKRIQNSRAHSPNINSTHLLKDFVGAMTREEESVAAIILFSISFKVTYGIRISTMTRSTTAKQLGHWNTPTFHSNVKGQLSGGHNKSARTVTKESHVS
tara:strand:+ start:358 stop:675 length:318 start_codon:yes stop_codon:yes gene_type:complete